MGTETEYGITVPGQTTSNHMLASSQVVNGYLNATTGAPRDRRPRWDFEEESPLRDARGFDAAAGPVIGASRDAADTLRRRRPHGRDHLEHSVDRRPQ